MKYGYLDESGAPGVASCAGDYLLVSLVVFESEEIRDESIEAIEALRERLRLPEDYEFHCTSNSTRPQAEFFKLLSELDFRFITVAIRKNDFKKTASYARLAKLVIDEVKERFSEMKIEMDSNPTLRTELRKRLREEKMGGIKVRERDSRDSLLVQVADYVANISGKKVKNTPKARELYGLIAKKVLAFIEIAD